MSTIAEGQVVSAEAAYQFASEWIKAWNDHDLDAVLDHFSSSAVFTSPMAAARGCINRQFIS